MAMTIALQPRTSAHHNRAAALVGLVAGVLLLAGTVGCSASGSTDSSRTPTRTAPSSAPDPSGTPTRTAPSSATDYAASANWLARPSSPARAVDIFYLYPTVWTRANASASLTAAVTDSTMRKGAAAALDAQASAFDTVGNVFAPYYRQASGDVLNLSVAKRDSVINGIPTTDAVAAFAYYLTHLNQGRPYILAGHSQGSNLLVNLLSGYLKDHPAAYSRMIAAYVIGYSVTKDYLAANPQLKFATGATDTGVVISYNTESPGMTGVNPVVLPGSVVINPITWTRTQDVAAANANLGSYIPKADGTFVRVSHLADARVDLAKGVLVCRTCSVSAYSTPNPVFPRGAFHPYDYSFYYFNIRANAAARAAAWTSAH
jgi:hypothetical protein